DIEALPEGERAELIDGEMFMMASPEVTHQDLAGWLYVRISRYIMEKQGSCKVFLAPFAVYIADDQHNYVEPDISVICDWDKMDKRGCHGAPDWIIEIVSPSGKYMDYVRKLALYQNVGVREYWLVDPERKSITVYRFERKEGPELYSFSDKVRAGIYEDFSIDFGEYEFLDFNHKRETNRN
ncbi:MAG: Uma2 family endonuclease, partial [Lachnospiraceae bacterium]|nr:Uma2 family endonuclease [Lachnospiraceae bacterium]